MASCEVKSNILYCSLYRYLYGTYRKRYYSRSRLRRLLVPEQMYMGFSNRWHRLHNWHPSNSLASLVDATEQSEQLHKSQEKMVWKLYVQATVVLVGYTSVVSSLVLNQSSVICRQFGNIVDPILDTSGNRLGDNRLVENASHKTRTS